MDLKQFEQQQTVVMNEFAPRALFMIDDVFDANVLESESIQSAISQLSSERSSKPSTSTSIEGVPEASDSADDQDGWVPPDGWVHPKDRPTFTKEEQRELNRLNKQEVRAANRERRKDKLKKKHKKQKCKKGHHKKGKGKKR